MKAIWILSAVFFADEVLPVHVLELKRPASGIALADLSGDERRELLLAREDGLSLRSLDSREAEVRLMDRDSPTATLVWTVVPGGVEDQLYVLKGGSRLLRLRKDEEPDVLLDGLEVELPAGVYSMPFVRNLRASGRPDVLLPTVKGLEIYYAREDGLQKGPLVQFESTRRWHLDAAVEAPVNREYRQRFTIANFSMKDHNDDGVLDFVVQEENAVRFYFSGRKGTLPQTPSLVLDLAELRSSLPQADEGRMDPSNLLRSLESVVTHEVHDFDGDGWSDLLVRTGNKVSLYEGGADGFDRTRARQVLKSSGNLLAAFSFDENVDGALDLCLLRIGDLSLAQVLLWLVAGGELEFDLYVYHQEEQLSFARKPSSRRSLRVDFPALVSIEDDLEQSGQDISRKLRQLPFAIHWTGSGRPNDVVLPAAKELRVYRDVAGQLDVTSPQAAWQSVIQRFDRESGGERELEINLQEFVEWTPITGGALRARLRERRADAVLRLPTGFSRTFTAHGVDFDRDGKDEVVAVLERSSPAEFDAIAVWKLP